VFTAEAKCEDYITRYVTNQAEWSSSNPSVLTVGPGGTATGISSGGARVTAVYQNVSASIDVSVVDSVESVSIVGDIPGVGETNQFMAYVRLSDWRTFEARQDVTWWSTNPAVATVDQQGRVKAVGIGETDLTATYEDVTGKLHLRIARRSPSGRLSISGNPPKVGSTSLFAAIMTYPDGTTEDVSGLADWMSLNLNVASVTNHGVIRGLAPGSVEIQAEVWWHSMVARRVIRIDR
jgi:uncharacterized protein YjdB